MIDTLTDPGKTNFQWLYGLSLLPTTLPPSPNGEEICTLKMRVLETIASLSDSLSVPKAELGLLADVVLSTGVESAASIPHHPKGSVLLLVSLSLPPVINGDDWAPADNWTPSPAEEWVVTGKEIYLADSGELAKTMLREYGVPLLESKRCLSRCRALAEGGPTALDLSDLAFSPDVDSVQGSNLSSPFGYSSRGPLLPRYFSPPVRFDTNSAGTSQRSFHPLAESTFGGERRFVPPFLTRSRPNGTPPAPQPVSSRSPSIPKRAHLPHRHRRAEFWGHNGSEAGIIPPTGSPGF